MMTSNDIDYSKTLSGQLLVATPQMNDARFQRKALLICQHDKKAAMGFIINQPSESVTFGNLAEQLKLNSSFANEHQPIYVGGPVEPQRGYVLHTDDQTMPGTVTVKDNICLSMHVDMVTEITRGMGPQSAKIVLGYASWEAGQLEKEMRESMWFHLPATTDMIFSTEHDLIWERSFAQMGMNAGSLSPQSGSA